MGESRVVLLIGVTAASLVGLLLLPPISQDQSYHDFADQRTLLGIPNFWNVVSNIPFIAIGAVGLRQFGRHPAQRNNSASACGRDAWISIADLLGQDRHAYFNGDDGGVCYHRRIRVSDHR